MKDRVLVTIYLIALIVGAAVIGIIVLAVRGDEIPEVLQIVVATGLGAMAGILAPSPREEVA